MIDVTIEQPESWPARLGGELAAGTPVGASTEPLALSELSERFESGFALLAKTAM